MAYVAMIVPSKFPHLRNPTKIICHKQTVVIDLSNPSSQTTYLSLRTRDDIREFSARDPLSLFRSSHKSFSATCSVSQGLEAGGVSTSFEDFSVATTGTSDDREIKLRVDVSGAKTQAIFDHVFSKMVAAAQPIPGFRRVKGGKTPNVPKDVLLEILGPSKVYKEVIKKIINSSVAEYVEKEDLKVTKNLRVEQSFEGLEVTFEPGKEFSFDAIIQLQEANTRKC